MRAPFVLGLSGSRSQRSKTARCADLVLQGIAAHGVSTDHVRLSDLDPAALLRGDMADPGITTLVDLVDAAHGIVIATPIFKASCSGLLKAGLDVLPQFALAGKVVLPLGTGGSLAHVLALDYGLRPILQSMGARHITQAHFLCESDVTVTDAAVTLTPQAEAPLRSAICNFLQSLTTLEAARWLGHPRPPAEPLDTRATSGRGPVPALTDPAN